MSLRKKLVSNVFYNFLDVFIISFLGYLFWIILGKFLVPEQYGIVSTVIGLFQLLIPITTIGLMSALPKIIPDYLSKNKLEKIRGSILFSFKITTLLSLLIGLGFYFFSPYLANVVYADANLIIPLKLLLPMLVFGTSMYIVKGGLIGYQEFKKMFIADTAGNIVKTLLTLAIVMGSAVALGGIIGFLTWPIITTLFCTYYLYKIIPKTKKTSVDKKKLLSYGMFAAIYGFMVYFIFQGGIILLGLLDTMTSVGFFRVAVLFGMFAHLPSQIISTSFSPNISDLWAKKQFVKLRQLVQISLKYILIMTIPIVTVFLMFSDFFVLLFFSAEYIPATGLFLTYFSGVVLLSLSYILLQTLYYTNEEMFLAKMITFGAVLNAVLGIILIPTLSAFGASFAFLIAQIIVFLIALVKVIKKLKINLSVFPIVILSSIIFLILTYLSKDFNIIVTAILVTFFGFIYLLMLLKLKAFDKDDIKFLDTLPSYGFMKKPKKFVMDMIRKELK